MKNLRSFLWVIPGVLLLGLLLLSRRDPQASVRSPLEGLHKINAVMELIRDLYVEEAEMDRIVDGAIRGMLEELDPHSGYIPASELREITEEFQGEFEGIGIYFQIRDKQLTVVSAIPGTPSDRLGLSPGDIITEIDGKSTFGITNEEVQRKLKGKGGTNVAITIRRPGLDEPLTYRITREKIPIYSVESVFMLDAEVGYLRLNRFMATSADEIREAMDKLRAQGMKKVVLDLRNNSGGFLEQAHKIADLFLPGGLVVVSTEGRREEFGSVLKSTSGDDLPDTPLIVLINQGSASASEIVAGAIQDHDRGLIAGQTSFGKGLVQRQLEMRDSSAVRLTIARYYTPSRRLIQRPFDKGLAAYYEEAMDEEDPNLDADSSSTRPVYKTRAGRTVYGGGGITPDVRIRSGRLTQYTSRLRLQQSFFDYANHAAAAGPLRKRLEGLGREAFLRDWQPDEGLLRDFTAFVGDKVPYDESEWRQDLVWIQGYLKREIARVVFDRDASLQVDLAIDPVLAEAVLLFPEAERIRLMSTRTAR
jgi:carboxyl-terminal processing protease